MADRKTRHVIEQGTKLYNRDTGRVYTVSKVETVLSNMYRDGWAVKIHFAETSETVSIQELAHGHPSVWEHRSGRES